MKARNKRGSVLIAALITLVLVSFTSTLLLKMSREAVSQTAMWRDNDDIKLLSYSAVEKARAEVDYHFGKFYDSNSVDQFSWFNTFTARSGDEMGSIGNGGCEYEFGGNNLFTDANGDQVGLWSDARYDLDITAPLKMKQDHYELWITATAYAVDTTGAKIESSVRKCSVLCEYDKNVEPAIDGIYLKRGGTIRGNVYGNVGSNDPTKGLSFSDGGNVYGDIRVAMSVLDSDGDGQLDPGVIVDRSEDGEYQIYVDKETYDGLRKDDKDNGIRPSLSY